MEPRIFTHVDVLHTTQRRLEIVWAIFPLICEKHIVDIVEKKKLIYSIEDMTFVDWTKDTSGGETMPDCSAPGRRRSTVLITGGAGFIGSATARRFLSRGDNVVVLDEMNDHYDVKRKEQNIRSLRQEFGNGRMEFFQGDLCDEQLVEHIFSKCNPNVVCHLGARVGVRPSIKDPSVYVHSNIKGTVVLLEAAVRHKNCGNFVYASSSSVYGESTAAAFKETDSIMRPLSQYAVSKATCELLAFTYNHLYGLNTCGLRFFTVYGPNGRPDMAPHRFIERIHRGLAIDLYGDGTSERDYTYVDDVVDGIVRACDRPLGNVVFNLGNGSPVSLREFVSIIENMLGKKAIINELPTQSGDVPRTCADITAAREMLGYDPKTTLTEGLKKTVDWYLNHPVI